MRRFIILITILIGSLQSLGQQCDSTTLDKKMDFLLALHGESGEEYKHFYTSGDTTNQNFLLERGEEYSFYFVGSNCCEEFRIINSENQIVRTNADNRFLETIYLMSIAFVPKDTALYRIESVDNTCFSVLIKK